MSPDSEPLGRRARPEPRWPHAPFSRREGLKLAAWLLLLASFPCVVVGLQELHERRQQAQESSALRALHEIREAQASFREEERAGLRRYGSLEELVDAGLLDEALRAGSRAGYGFEVHPSPTTPEFLWCVYAIPLDPDSELRRYATNHAQTSYLLPGAGAPKAGCLLPESAVPFG